LVRLNHEALPVRARRALPFRAGRAYLFLGEIANMGGHCVVADAKTGRLYVGYHTENFVELSDDEV
jgi:hypothetical protein